MPQRSKPKFLNTMVGTQLLLSDYMSQVDYQLDWFPFDKQLDWSPVNYQHDWPTVKPQQTSFSKSPNSQPIASGHDIIHTPNSFPIWGLLWQLWLSYPLQRCSQHILQPHLSWSPNSAVYANGTDIYLRCPKMIWQFSFFFPEDIYIYIYTKRGACVPLPELLSMVQVTKEGLA